MATVYNLQHQQYVDRVTGVEFGPVERARVMRTETDELGRETRYVAHSMAVVTDEEHLEYFRNRPHMFEVVEDGAAPVSEPEFQVVEREAGGWFDVRGPDGEVRNESALREEKAHELAEHLNSEGV